MFELPYNLALINPAVDIFIFVLLTYLVIGNIYKKDIIFGRAEKLVWVDFKITLVFLILGYLNYGAEEIIFGQGKISWVIYIIFLQFGIELPLMSFFKKNRNK